MKEESYLCPGCGKTPTDEKEGMLIKRPEVGLVG